MKKKIFAVISFLAMLLCFYFSFYLAYLEKRTEHFQKTEAVVKQADGKIGYFYYVGKKEYFSTYNSILDYLFQADISLNLSEGQKIICFYDKENPRIAVLRKGFFIEKYLITSLILGIVFFFIGLNYWRDSVPESCGLG